MSRKMKTFAIHTLIGSGFTQAEARADALLKATHALEQASEGPFVLSFRGDVWLCSPDGAGVWSYSRVEGQTARGHRIFGSGYSSLNECAQAARLHLAQYTYAGGMDESSGDIIIDQNDRRNHISWVGWQDRYSVARDAGNDDESARRIADAA